MGRCPIPSAMQPELPIPGKSPFLSNPRCTVRAGHAIQPLNAFIKLLASCPVRRSSSVCRTCRIGRAGQGFCIPLLAASDFHLVFPRGIFRDTGNPLDSPPPGGAVFVIPVQPSRCSSTQKYLFGLRASGICQGRRCIDLLRAFTRLIAICIATSIHLSICRADQKEK